MLVSDLLFAGLISKVHCIQRKKNNTLFGRIIVTVTRASETILHGKFVGMICFTPPDSFPCFSRHLVMNKKRLKLKVPQAAVIHGLFLLGAS